MLNQPRPVVTKKTTAQKVVQPVSQPKRVVNSTLLTELYSLPKQTYERSFVSGKVDTTIADQLKKALEEDGIRISSFIETAAKVYLADRKK